MRHGKCGLVIAASAAVLLGCVGPKEPRPLEGSSPFARTRLVMEQSYVAGMNASHYQLPSGVYPAEAQDSRGVYYRAPAPIRISGLVALGGEELVEGGIYVPHSSARRAMGGLWLYVIDGEGGVTADAIPGPLSWDEGDRWRIETVDFVEEPAARPGR